MAKFDDMFEILFYRLKIFVIISRKLSKIVLEKNFRLSTLCK